MITEINQAVTEEQTKAMIDEYVKGGKFAEYVDKACYAYHDTVLQECQKVTVWEYFQSVTKGCNKNEN